LSASVSGDETLPPAFSGFQYGGVVVLPLVLHLGLALQDPAPPLPGEDFSEVPGPRSGILFLPVWLLCRALLWFCCSGIRFPLVWLSYRALLWRRGFHPPVREVMP